jgi:hypothetical protein
MFKAFKNRVIVQTMYAALIIIVYLLVGRIGSKNIYDAVTAFLIVDISNTERKNLNRHERVYFYDSISLISRAVICGFIAPLLYVLFLGNAGGLIYALIYNIGLDEELYIYRTISNAASIIPALISESFLYIVYICRNKKLGIDFKGDYLINSFTRPLLNADIMAAYVESVNFYYYFTGSNTEYLKSYGDYKNKINEVCIRDYLSIAYGICLIVFILFYVINFEINVR